MARNCQLVNKWPETKRAPASELASRLARGGANNHMSQSQQTQSRFATCKRSTEPTTEQTRGDSSEDPSAREASSLPSARRPLWPPGDPLSVSFSVATEAALRTASYLSPTTTTSSPDENLGSVATISSVFVRSSMFVLYWWFGPLFT